MSKSLFIALLLSSFFACSFDIIPLPNKLKQGRGHFSLESQAICSDLSKLEGKAELSSLMKLLQKNVLEKTNIDLPLREDGRIKFRLLGNKADSLNEAYSIDISKDSILLSAYAPVGLFYALQTFSQLLDSKCIVPCVSIEDKPSFAYRGVHIDVSRHFMPIAALKRQVDLMAKYKLNRFHWHLVDGGGWRFDCKKYPALTQKSAFRTESDWVKWWEKKDRRFVDTADSAKAYGGYYSREQMKELVQYAKERYITIIPEIEMPGHSEEVFWAYPHLQCPSAKGLSSDFCIGNPDTFNFLKDVLDEIMEIFPSRYIHIGGDEASKQEWKSCPLCIKLMKDKNFDNVDKLQSYCIEEIEKYVRSKGREIIGWDEILEGGLAEHATVMSWRGESGGEKAATMKHQVIMSPGVPLYLDHYQSNPVLEPKAIGGYNTLERVYNYHPVPKSLGKEFHRYILGAQVNLWSEYVEDDKHMEYMLWPRALALAELSWTKPARKDFTSFLKRANLHVKEIRKEGYNAYPLKNIEIVTKVDTLAKRLELRLGKEYQDSWISYRLDGQIPDINSPRYDSLIFIKDSANLVLQQFDSQGKRLFEPTRWHFDYHKAIAKKIFYNKPFSSAYPAKGITSLSDGYKGTWDYHDTLWQGFKQGLDLVVDMGKIMPLKSVDIRFMQAKGVWIYIPGKVEVLVSDDNQTYRSVKILSSRTPRDKQALCVENFSFSLGLNARYVRIKTDNVLVPGEFFFTDEIVVY